MFDFTFQCKLFKAELPFWRILLFWSGTCLKEIATGKRNLIFHVQTICNLLNY